MQQVKGLGPLAAELVVVCGANAPALPCHERRLDAEIAERDGPGHTLAEVPVAWRPLPHLGRRPFCLRCASSAPARSRPLSRPARPDTLSDHA